MKNHIDKIRNLVGEAAVLIACRFRSKQPVGKWKDKTVFDMRDSCYLDKLYNAGNVGVVLGEPSGGLISIDFDDEEALKDFRQCNPQTSETLTTRGARGANLWLRMEGDYPSLFKFKRDGEEVGEFRSDGGYTLIHGIHPKGMEYEVIKQCPVMTVKYEDIVWPDGYDCGTSKVVTENTENTEGYRREGGEKGWCGGSVLFDPKLVANDFISFKCKTNHTNLFKIARRIRGEEVKHGRRADMGELIAIFECWYSKSTPALNPELTREEYLGEFLDSYERVTHPEMDDLLETAMERVHAQPLPPEAEGSHFETPEFKQLVALCYHLSELSVNGVFFLSCRTAQRLLDLNSHMKAARWLSLLVKLGILKISEPGRAGKQRATRYTYASAGLIAKNHDVRGRMVG